MNIQLFSLNLTITCKFGSILIKGDKKCSKLISDLTMHIGANRKDINILYRYCPSKIINNL